MAMVDVPVSSSDKVTEKYGVIDYHIENVLARLNDEPLKDVMEDVLVLCSTDELRDTRDKLFAVAKKKVSDDVDRGPTDNDAVSGKKRSTMICDPWGLTPRRSKKRLDEDVCRLYLFTIGKEFKFPCSLLKRGTYKPAETQRDIRIALRSTPRGHTNTSAVEVPRETVCMARANVRELEDTPDPITGATPVTMGDRRPSDVMPSSGCVNTGDQSDISRTNSMDSLLPLEYLESDTGDETIDMQSEPETESEPECEADEQTPPQSAVDVSSDKYCTLNSTFVTDTRKTRTRDFAVQCTLVGAIPLVLFTPRKTMAGRQDESWEDYIEPEQENGADPPAADADDRDDASDRGDEIERILVEREEFDAHTEYAERMVAEHEASINTLDAWNANFEHRIDVMDAVLHEKMRLMKVRQEETDNELFNMKRQLDDHVKRCDDVTTYAKKVSGTALNPITVDIRANAGSNQQVPLPQRPPRVNNRRSGSARAGSGNEKASVSGGKPLVRPRPIPGPPNTQPKKDSGSGHSVSWNDTDPEQQRSGAAINRKNADNNLRRPGPGNNMKRQGPSGSKANQGKGATSSVPGAVGPPAQTGARPKTAMKGNESRSYGRVSEGRDTGNRQTHTNDADSEYDDDSTYKVVTRNGWSSKKRKREYSGPNTQKPARPIKGFSNKQTKELSVQGLSNDGFDSLEEIEESVTAYCHERGVELIFIRVFPRKHEFKTVGCKIAVKDEDVNTVTNRTFWPDDVNARKWHPGNKNWRDDDKGDAQSPDQI